ncbi:MAG: hypothetical protein ABJ215_02995 [Alphaproteobacteria bacterium]
MSREKDRINGPVRRVVTGTRADGKSAVLYDSDNPYRYSRGGGSTIVFNEIWTFDTSPAPLAGERDGADRPMSHSPPAEGAHFRVIQSAKEDDAQVDQEEADQQFASMNEGGLSERLPGARHWNMHRTRTVDYGIVTFGERIHVLPESEFTMRKGDIVVQLAHFHSWDSTRGDNVMIFDMIGGEYPDGSGE